MITRKEQMLRDKNSGKGNKVQEGLMVHVDRDVDSTTFYVEAEKTIDNKDTKALETFTKALLGDDFAAFDLDWDDEQLTVGEPVYDEFDMEWDDLDHEEAIDLVDDEYCDDEICDEDDGSCEEEEVIEVDSDEEEISDEVSDRVPMDMINGKLVPAKNPEASEVEIDDEDEDDEEDTEDEESDEEDLDESKSNIDANSDLSDEEFVEEFGKKVASKKFTLDEEIDYNNLSDEEFLKVFGKEIRHSLK